MSAGGDPMRWVWRGIAGATLVLGWVFILWQNKFHITPPVVIVALGYLAVIATVTNLWRVGAAAVAPEDTGNEAWSRPLGAHAELDREKKTLLKAIKEAEFDHAMGKLSKADADELIRMYRSRAIEVIKEMDRIDAGKADTARDKIKREVAARIALDNEKKPKKKGKADAAKAGEAKAGGAKVDAKTDDAKTGAKAEEAKAEEAKADDVAADSMSDDGAAVAKPEVATDDAVAADAKADASDSKEATS